MGWIGPWNVGEDDGGGWAMQVANGGNGSPLAKALANPWANNGLGPMMAPNMVLGKNAASPPAMSPEQAAAFCAQFPQHPWAAFLSQQLAQLANAGLGVRMAVDGRFSPEMFYRSMPTKTRMEPLPLGSSGVVAAAGTFTFNVTVQKPFKGVKLTFTGDTGAFLITSMTAAGQTVTAASGSIPAARYAAVDNLPNIAFPALTAGATISITVTNFSAGNGTLVGVIDGETGEA